MPLFSWNSSLCMRKVPVFCLHLVVSFAFFLFLRCLRRQILTCNLRSHSDSLYKMQIRKNVYMHNMKPTIVFFSQTNILPSAPMQYYLPSNLIHFWLFGWFSKRNFVSCFWAHTHPFVQMESFCVPQCCHIFFVHKLCTIQRHTFHFILLFGWEWEQQSTIK